MYNGRPGQPISRVRCYSLFQKYAKLPGLPEIPYPHVARATMITHAYEAGLQGEDIQRTVGHASITMTEGYSHTAKQHRKSRKLRGELLGVAGSGYCGVVWREGS